MTLRDFLKANGDLTKFKKLYHERSQTKITYRQIEANLLTAGEDFIKKALNLNGAHCGYWLTLNARWNSRYAANKSKSKPSGIDKTLGSWLKANGLEEKFKNGFTKRYGNTSGLMCALHRTDPNAINGSLYWDSTDEGYNFWLKQHTEWQKFCKNNK